MNFQNITFITSAVDINGYPESHLDEIMIWGKSNVGKSSFINALTGVNGISKVSSKPGKTKTINFFDVDNKFMLVDVPGYGYASVSKKMQIKFLDFINEYIKNRSQLKLVIMLLDSRHKPTKYDKERIDSLLKHNINILIVATKWDKLNQKDRVAAFKNFKKVFDFEKDDFIQTSSENKLGFKKIREMLK